MKNNQFSTALKFTKYISVNGEKHDDTLTVSTFYIYYNIEVYNVLNKYNIIYVYSTLRHCKFSMQLIILILLIITIILQKIKKIYNMKYIQKLNVCLFS